MELILDINKNQLEQGILRAYNMSSNFNTKQQYRTLLAYTRLLIYQTKICSPIFIMDAADYQQAISNILNTAEERYNAINSTQ